METSAKATSFPNWARLKRDKGNYPSWRRHIIDVLQASGCEQAITEEFERLAYETDDSSSSGDDSDDFHQGLSRLGLGKHSPQPSPTPSQVLLPKEVLPMSTANQIAAMFPRTLG